ncbi:sigma-70 family RNA polymerase sigma factor [Halobacillus naozhouensis]|uniref:Sigma-70 family RNA polymerase sigma factor n=1 Tax=Halobacillus naozhouensis TaxID=554880 RepID=A0ABY8IU65_9BACI|nr:sigma-70 family RNA polymerase sigma factor [Halobacillus naozhouensis]WFT73622.1 sigma-70 family RNA polymerase sigma factor [Halobacillus naozhouensis]
MHDKREKQEHQSTREILVDLMEEYGDMVLRVAFTYVKERQLAEDLSQEIFIKCYQSLHTFEERSSYRTWLYRITVNYCKDYVRSWPFRNLIPRSVVRPGNDRSMDSVSSQVVQREENDLLFKKVLKLSVKLREVVIFYYYENLSVNEIACVLQVNPNTVKSRLHRARKSLRHHIEGGMILEE